MSPEGLRPFSFFPTNSADDQTLAWGTMKVSNYIMQKVMGPKNSTQASLTEGEKSLHS